MNRARAQVIDFSIPYFHSGVSLLASPKRKSEIPLLAFLLPFSPELWIAIFTSLNITAVAVAVYEWLSPFGLNPWGRQRSKNFSLSSGKCKNFLNPFSLSFCTFSIQIICVIVVAFAERLAFFNLNCHLWIVLTHNITKSQSTNSCVIPHSVSFYLRSFFHSIVGDVGIIVWSFGCI